MASGHVNRTYRPNTWLHRPSLRREDFSCQPGAVHTWHLASFRCDAEFGPLSAHIGHRVAIKLDLWVHALVTDEARSIVEKRSVSRSANDAFARRMALQSARRANHFVFSEMACPAPFAKIFSFRPDPNQFTDSHRLVPDEGRSRVVTSAGRDAVDAAALGDVRGWQGGSIRPVS